MDKLIFLMAILTCSLNVFGQSNPTAAFNYKLDYNVPQSPAFSVLGANPTTVMRATAPQEMVVNMASNFISGNKADPGFAVDFNPYFNFGGRLQSGQEFRNNGFKRMLANAQLSFATIDSRVYPTDLLIGSGLRITLFDSKDNLYDKELGEDIDNILRAVNEEEEAPGPDFGGDDFEETVVIPSLKDAYDRGKERYRKRSGGALALGAALASRARGRSLQTDSLRAVRNQLWLSGQFDFGSGFSINGMVLYQNDMFGEISENGIVAGFAMRHYGKKSIILGELTYDSLIEGIEFSAYTEFYIIPQITMTVSLGYQVDEFTQEDGLVIKPGVKWNLSELGK